MKRSLNNGYPEKTGSGLKTGIMNAIPLGVMCWALILGLFGIIKPGFGESLFESMLPGIIVSLAAGRYLDRKWHTSPIMMLAIFLGFLNLWLRSMSIPAIIVLLAANVLFIVIHVRKILGKREKSG